jgi:phosphate:Na+ symporter
MGQNIGTTVTALLSSIGTNKNARRAAVVHLMFNVIGVIVWLTVFCIVRYTVSPAILDASASRAGIAVAHSAFNILCTMLLLPAGDLLEKLAIRMVPDDAKADTHVELDERLLGTPSMALERSRVVATEMAGYSVQALKDALKSLYNYTPELADSIRQNEDKCDHYEDTLSTYLVKLSSRQMSAADSEEAAALLKTIGDIERISDHAVNILESVEELRSKGLSFSQDAMDELSVLSNAVSEILDKTLNCFSNNDIQLAQDVEPLEQVIDTLKENLRTRHILRLQKGLCSIELGFILSDLLTDLERTSDHCSNIAGCVIDAAQHNLNLHETLRATHTDSASFKSEYELYAVKYSLPDIAK